MSGITTIVTRKAMTSVIALYSGETASVMRDRSPEKAHDRQGRCLWRSLPNRANAYIA